MGDNIMPFWSPPPPQVGFRPVLVKKACVGAAVIVVVLCAAAVCIFDIDEARITREESGGPINYYRKLYNTLIGKGKKAESHIDKFGHFISPKRTKHTPRKVVPSSSKTQTKGRDRSVPSSSNAHRERDATEDPIVADPVFRTRAVS